MTGLRAPWIRQSRQDTVRSSAGMAWTGGNASTDRPPASSAARSARHPVSAISQSAAYPMERDRTGCVSVRRLARLAFIMTIVFLGDQVSLHHDRDIGGVELGVDHRAFADESAESQVALDQRRQTDQRGLSVDFLALEPTH